MKTMRTAAPREGLDHDTLLSKPAAFGRALLAAAALGASPWQPAAAQNGPPCTAITNDAERLACYDRALRGTAAEPAPPAAPPVAAPAGAAPSAPPPAETPRRERTVRESAAPAAPAAPAARAAGASGDERDGNRIVPIVIVGMRGLPGRETIFTTQDGTNWVQTDTQRIAGLPEPPFEAELKPGSLGSYFLVPKDHGRAIRVREGNR
jgi:hypothetical protein